MVGNVTILRDRTYSAEGTGPRGSWEEGDQRRGKKNNLPHFWPEITRTGLGQLQLAWRRAPKIQKALRRGLPVQEPNLILKIYW